MATTKIECVHILNLWIGMERLFDSCARQVLKTCQVRSSVVRQHDVVGARRLIITLGRERWAQSTKDLASALDKSADWVTYIQREGGEVKILLGTDALSGTGPSAYVYVAVWPQGQPGKAPANLEAPETRPEVGKRFPEVGSVVGPNGITWACFRMDTAITAAGGRVDENFRVAADRSRTISCFQATPPKHTIGAARRSRNQ